MNRKQYWTAFIAIILLAVGALVVNIYVLTEADYTLWIFIAMTVAILILRSRITAPLQQFSNKFNMLVDYDLDVEAALELAQEQLKKCPSVQVEELVRIYLGMAYYYNARYDDAIKTFNQIKLNKVNSVYHVLVFAFTAYAAYEQGDKETFDTTLGRMEEVKNKINKKYISFASSYLEILRAIQNIEVNPEGYKEVIEKNFSREDGYISTRLVYNYRLAWYYKVVGNKEEMDICLAKVIANGKNHHTAQRAKEMFEGSVSVEDYVFADPYTEESIEDVEVVEEPLQIDQIEEVEVVEETPVETVVAVDPFENVSTFSRTELEGKSVAELKALCKETGITGYSKYKKNELIDVLLKK